MKKTTNGVAAVNTTKSTTEVKSGGTKHVHISIVLLVNPRAGSCLAKKFITDYESEHLRLLCLDDKIVACKMNIYDVTSKEDKVKYIAFLEGQMPNGKVSH